MITLLFQSPSLILFLWKYIIIIIIIIIISFGNFTPELTDGHLLLHYSFESFSHKR